MHLLYVTLNRKFISKTSITLMRLEELEQNRTKVKNNLSVGRETVLQEEIKVMRYLYFNVQKNFIIFIAYTSMDLCPGRVYDRGAWMCLVNIVLTFCRVNSPGVLRHVTGGLVASRCVKLYCRYGGRACVVSPVSPDKFFSWNSHLLKKYCKASRQSLLINVIFNL